MEMTGITNLVLNARTIFFYTFDCECNAHVTILLTDRQTRVRSFSGKKKQFLLCDIRSRH